MSERIEIRDGKEYRVTVLPASAPWKHRSTKTRYQMKHVGKPGNLNYTPSRKRH